MFRTTKPDNQKELLNFLTELCMFVYTYEGLYMRVALNLIPSILLCWLSMTKADVGGITVEDAPSQQ